MESVNFIQVILPLRLEWEPYYSVPEGIEVCTGDRVRVFFAGSFYTGAVSSVGTVPQIGREKIRPIEALEEGLPRVSRAEIEFWRFIADYYLCTVGEVYKAAYPKLTSAGSRLKIPEWTAPDDGISLSKVQEDAIGRIRESKKPVILHGITGSGKTEIYLKLAIQALQEGKNVLYLVPEIALSHQLEERIKSHVPSVSIYHSGLTPAKRKLVAANLRSGAQYMVLGTRSALFLPHRNLGLIIVDEEHDASYKQDTPAPRYHARESAIMLAGIHGAKVVMGSATPSMEALYNAEIGRFTKVDLKERFYQGEDLDIEIIDLSAERRKGGMAGNFSIKLLAHMKDSLDAGGKVLLLRSRRAYSPAVQCLDCGFIPKCPHCNVSMALHRNPSRLVCHYCGHTDAFTGKCPQCGGELLPLGAGTQKLVDELIEYFPTARIGRMDSDSAADNPQAIEEFANGETDILIGTQMITKGFDFPGLSLVAVIEADNILAQQDFRADEKAVQLLEQLRGRGGRRGEKALFVIQTREPRHPVFSLLGEDGDISAQMLEERRLFNYPPFTRMVKIGIKDKSERRLDYMAAELVQSLMPLGVAIVGPYSPTVDKIADEYIREIRITLLRDKSLTGRKKGIYSAVRTLETDKKYTGHISIDVDPA